MVGASARQRALVEKHDALFATEHISFSIVRTFTALYRTYSCFDILPFLNTVANEVVQQSAKHKAEQKLVQVRGLKECCSHCFLHSRCRRRIEHVDGGKLFEPCPLDVFTMRAWRRLNDDGMLFRRRSFCVAVIASGQRVS
mmetsp:Transcript_10562/g.17715  ORF Transcript_10562/g.17715 Transcript_10562/m.17715 type:complete len:141 (+) Transcript_10562:520-942(+)